MFLGNNENMRLSIYVCVCGFFLSVKFATSLLALLAGEKNLFVTNLYTCSPLLHALVAQIFAPIRPSSE